jgi:hypothetical protein
MNAKRVLTSKTMAKAERQRLGKYQSCEHCAERFYVALSRERQSARRGAKVQFCSTACMAASRVGTSIRPAQDRFWSKVERGSAQECWEWEASRFPDGYGCFGYEGRTHHAQRIAYILAYGDFDRSLEVRHTCDNPPCCNPAHLLLGTHADNMRDMAERGRTDYPRLKGDEHSSSKLKSEQVLEIRRRAAAGESRVDLGLEFGVTPSNISMIATRRSWRHLPDEVRHHGNPPPAK